MSKDHEYPHNQHPLILKRYRTERRCGFGRHVRFGSSADMAVRLRHVRLPPVATIERTWIEVSFVPQPDSCTAAWTSGNHVRNRRSFFPAGLQPPPVSPAGDLTPSQNDVAGAHGRDAQHDAEVGESIAVDVAF